MGGAGLVLGERDMIMKSNGVNKNEKCLFMMILKLSLIIHDI